MNTTGWKMQCSGGLEQWISQKWLLFPFWVNEHQLFWCMYVIEPSPLTPSTSLNVSARMPIRQRHLVCWHVLFNAIVMVSLLHDYEITHIANGCHDGSWRMLGVAFVIALICEHCKISEFVCVARSAKFCCQVLFIHQCFLNSWICISTNVFSAVWLFPAGFPLMATLRTPKIDEPKPWNGLLPMWGPKPWRPFKRGWWLPQMHCLGFRWKKRGRRLKGHGRMGARNE